MKTAAQLLAAVSIVAVGACSGDRLGPTVPGQQAAATNAGGKVDTTVVIQNREWRLQTIRGVVRGLPSGGVRDTLQFVQYGGGTAIPNATIEIHKFTLPSTDLGIVATIKADADGQFQYVISEPLIVRTGQPSPNTTYRLTITPPSGSPYATRTAAQVIFAEQFAPNQTVWEYYVYRP